LIVAPAAANDDGDLIITRALKRPVIGRGDAFNDIERIRPWMLCELRKGHAVSEKVASKWVGEHANRTHTRLLGTPRIGTVTL
jgi:hypothetical protein